MRVLNIRAVSDVVQLSGAGLESPNPGREGTTTLKDVCLGPVAAGPLSVSKSIRGSISRKDPGHPCSRIIGTALGS
jgi:hypothetical protein